MSGTGQQDIPLVMGVDEGTDDKVCAQLLVAHNVQQRRRGTFERRFGISKVIGGTSPAFGYDVTAPGASCEILTSLRGETVRTGGGRCYGNSLVANNGAPGAVYRGKTSNVYGSSEQIVTHQGKEIYNMVNAVNAAKTLIAYAWAIKSELTNSNRVYMRVDDVATGEPILQDCYIGDTELEQGGPTITWFNSRFIVTHLSDSVLSDGKIKYVSFNPATDQIDAAGTLLSDFIVYSYDVCTYGDYLYVLYQSAAAASLVIRKFSATFVDTAHFSIVDTPTELLTGMSICVTDTATPLFLVGTMGTEGVGGNTNVKAYGVYADLHAGKYGPATLETFAYAIAGLPDLYIGVSSIPGSDNGVYVWRSDELSGLSVETKRGIYWQVLNSSGSNRWSTKRHAHYVSPLSRTFCRGTEGYIVGCYLTIKPSTFAQATPEVPGSVWVLDLGLNESDYHAPARALCTLLPRQIFATPRFYATMTVASQISADKYIVSSPGRSDYLATAASWTIGWANVSIARITIDFSERPRHSSELGGLHMSGGNIIYYDGSQCVETSFHYFPDWERIILAANSVYIPPIPANAMTPSSTYAYAFTYEWIDSNGDVMRSNFSSGKLVTLGASDYAVDIVAPLLTLTEKGTVQGQLAGPDAGVHLVAYRTTANPNADSAYYRVGSFYAKNNTFDADVGRTDHMGDVELVKFTQLDTQTLESVAPPSSTYMCSYGARTVLAGTEDDSIYFSSEYQIGSVVGFNEGIRIAPFHGGRVVACAQHQSSLLIFKTTSTWYVQGEPAGPTGDPQTNSLTSPQPLSLDHGCADPGSVVSTPEGTFFRSKAGIMMANQTDVSFVGEQIRNTIGEATQDTITSAVYVPEDDRVMFLLSNGTVAVYDVKNKAWYTWSYNDENADPVVPKYITYLNGEVRFVDLHGDLYIENRGTSEYVDDGTPIAWFVETGWIQLSSLEDYKRIKRVSILGKAWNACDITVETLVDYKETVVQSSIWTYTDVAAMSSLQLHVHPITQKCTSMRFKISSGGSGGLPGRGVSLTGLAAEYMVFGKLSRKQPSERKR